MFLLLAFLDLEFTKRKISEYGVKVELNPVIRFLISKLGIEYGCDLGVVAPTLIFAAWGWYHPELLAFMLGVRTCLFLFQLQNYAK